MMSQTKTIHSFFLTLQFFFLEFLKTFFLFPFWWYGQGLLFTMRWCARSMQDTAINLGLMVWIKNLFIPMYGETDIASRLISFFLRLIIIFGRSLVLFFWSVFLLTLFFLYLLIPVATIFVLILF